MHPSLRSAFQSMIKHSREEGQSLSLKGLDATSFLYFLWSWYQGQSDGKASEGLIFCLSSESEAERFYEKLKSLHLAPTFILYGNENIPYFDVFTSNLLGSSHFETISQVCSQTGAFFLVTTLDGLNLFRPSREFIYKHRFSIKVEDICSPQDLASRLVALGYFQATTVEEPGTFCSKGEIFDIYPIGGVPVRIHYFDELIEYIYKIDRDSYKTKKDELVQELVLDPSLSILAQDEHAKKTFKKNISMPSAQFHQKFEKRKQIFARLNDSLLFEGVTPYIPLFFDHKKTIVDYFEHPPTIFYLGEASYDDTFSELFKHYSNEFDQLKDNLEADCLLPDPKALYRQKSGRELPSLVEIVELPDERSGLVTPISIYFNHLGINLQADKKEFLKAIFCHLETHHSQFESITFCYQSDSARNEYQYLCDQFECSVIKNKTQYQNFPMENGFFIPDDRSLVICEGDLFRYKRIKAKKKISKDVNLFAEQLATLKEGDFVIHATHGMAKYLGLESLSQQGTSSDFLVLEYANNDKVYVPVYKLDLVQKHSDGNAQQKVNNLRKNKFLLAKQRAKESAKKLAFDLIKLQAMRQTKEAFSFSAPGHYYKEFELEFPFKATADQENAIDDVVSDMQKMIPMDRLVCGDVGFGKTEVAMRAAFLAVLDKKQVAVLVPTTILCLQHFQSFVGRFKKFPVQIEYISRFKSAKEVQEVYQRLKNHQIDILIGTHKILSDKVEFKDLGLIIVDEEQRFGVNHKEKLKSFKESTDFLTLTATPIPRTMQLSFMGLKDLSLIQTPPPKRQSIKTYILKEEDKVIQEAINKELARGGQVFFVHNRVQNIESIALYVKDLVPQAKVIVAHGQMKESLLEKRMGDFYQKKGNVLLSTTIIESGLDIPNANTMIVNRADTFGLSQLHQLRGRIGRSERKAYCYFVIPKHLPLSEVASKRLKALALYQDIGSGFSIASSDLEIRGGGNILGAEQSGHIENIGLELYMELVEEAIKEIKGERQLFNKNIEFNIPDQALIPESFIKDSSLRLKYYKRLATGGDSAQVESIREEIEDSFGVLPRAAENLIAVLKCKISLQETAIKSIGYRDNQVFIYFHREILEQDPGQRDKVLEVFMKRPKVYKVNPNFSVIYTAKKKMDLAKMIHFIDGVSPQLIG